MAFFLFITFVIACAALISAREALARIKDLAGRFHDLSLQDPFEPAKTMAPYEGPESLAPLEIAEENQPPPLPAVLSSEPLPPPSTSVQLHTEPAEEVAEEAEPQPEPAVAVVRNKPVLNWEQFLGVKMFAWVGGLLAFLCIAFFVKLSLERNWISNELRVAISYASGAAILAAGTRMLRNVRYLVLAQTLCATGILMLYGTTFAAHAVYDFVSSATAFGIMAVITTGAFLLAVRANAQVVAILGMLGGFLTPPLCSSHQDHAVGLFSYIALLDLGLIAVSRFRRWHYLISLGALGTVLMQFGWCTQFFHEGGYAFGSKTWLVTGVFGLFAMLFAIGTYAAKEDEEPVTYGKASTWAVAAAGMLAAFTLNTYSSITSRPELLFSLTAVLLATVLASDWGRHLKGLPAKIALGAVFLHTSDWISKSGSDHPVALVIYVSLLTIAALWTTRRHDWTGLPEVCAAGTVIGEFAWLVSHFHACTQSPSSIAAVMSVALALPLLHHLMSGSGSKVSAVILSASAMLFAFVLLAVSAATSHLLMLYGFVFAINALVLLIAWNRPHMKLAQPLVSGATFVHLGAWTVVHLTADRLLPALGLYLFFGVAHTLYALLWTRRHPSVNSGTASTMPLLTIGMMLLPVFKSSEVSLMIWPAFILANLIAMTVAWMNGNLRIVLTGMGLTLFAALVWLLKLPTAGVHLSQFMGVLGALSLVFMTAASLMIRHVLKKGLRDASLPPVALAVSSALMPFALLALATLQLDMPVPTLVFGLALVLVLFLLGTSVVMKEGVLSLVALVSTVIVMTVWHTRHYHSWAAVYSVAWYAGYTLLFTAFPFIFRSTFKNDIWPWITSAASGLGTFLLMRDVLMPMSHPGVLPLIYAIPPLLGLWGVVKLQLPDTAIRDRILAWFGGVALLFITLIFPMEFTRQWITFSWAMEGAALIWLYTRVPQRGLVYVGLSLLAVVFVRLGLNFQIMETYARGERLILNWHLAAYGTAIASMLLSARWLRSPLDRIDEVELRPVLYALAGILGFVWINVEITDAFTPAGQSGLVIDFHNANVPRRMTYSIAWGAYALLMIILGFIKTNRGARYAGIALMSITILKVFFRDLSTLDNVYRIGALGAVALMALGASFAYQRWFEKTNSRQ